MPELVFTDLVEKGRVMSRWLVSDDGRVVRLRRTNSIVLANNINAGWMATMVRGL